MYFIILFFIIKYFIFIYLYINSIIAAASKRSKKSEAMVVKIKTHGVPDGRSYVFINSDQCIRFDT